jgi:hypothetical protein
VNGRGWDLDPIVLVYYCGHTAQRPCWEDRPHEPGLGVTAGAGMVALALVAFLGAVILIVAQRRMWPTISPRRAG